MVGRGVALAAAGAILGLMMAAALSGTLRSILFGVGALDPITFAAAAACRGESFDEQPMPDLDS